MTKGKKAKQSNQIVELVVKGIQERKGKDIVVLDLRKLPHAICDYYVVCHGTSNTHTEAVAQSIEDEIFLAIDEKPVSTEGFQNAEWILLDYFSVVVHVFQEEQRHYYKIEDLWADAEVTHYND